MQHANFEAELPVSCHDAFNVVSDLRGYTDFMPILKRVDVFDESDRLLKARFVFHLDNVLGKLVEQFNVKDLEPVSLIGWDDDRQIRAQSLSGPLKKIVMTCTLTELAAERTRADIYIGFESGYTWLVDKPLLIWANRKGNALIKDIGPIVKDIVERRKQRTLFEPSI